ncbi:MAG: GntR family transcriptional regulator [Bacteroidaceae bacterium]|nr:GntR family transcriptional regulator [Bacteroidaceae bacterium]
MDFKDNKAIYLQIADYLCDEILQGKYLEEERIPSVREYASIVEVNVNTCMRTYDWLQNQDIIFTKRGLGYFVAKGAKDAILAMRKKDFFEDFIPELSRKMQTLSISPEELVEELKKISAEATPE